MQVSDVLANASQSFCVLRVLAANFCSNFLYICWFGNLLNSFNNLVNSLADSFFCVLRSQADCVVKMVVIFNNGYTWCKLCQESYAGLVDLRICRHHAGSNVADAGHFAHLLEVLV